jgi:hypothetical protein
MRTTLWEASLWARRLSISENWQRSNPWVALTYVVVAPQKPATMNFPRISSISYEFDDWD